jgi:hypothetical protein
MRCFRRRRRPRAYKYIQLTDLPLYMEAGVEKEGDGQRPTCAAGWVVSDFHRKEARPHEKKPRGDDDT